MHSIEAHLVMPWSTDFRAEFGQIGTLRSRFPTQVPFLAMTATLKAKRSRPGTQKILGFAPGDFHDVHLSIDRPEIYIRKKILQHSINNIKFPDFAYLVPCFEAPGPVDIERTVIACKTRDQVTHFVNWWSREAKKRAPCGDVIADIIQPFHSLVQSEDRVKTVEGLKSGYVRIVVATCCANVGLDLDFDHVICLDVPDALEGIGQWGGRSARGWGCVGTLTICMPDSLRIQSWEESRPDSYAPSFTEKQLHAREEHRNRYPPSIILFLNAECTPAKYCELLGEKDVVKGGVPMLPGMRRKCRARRDGGECETRLPG